MNGLRIAKRYAEALFSMAKEGGRTQDAMDDLVLASQALEAVPWAARILDHPEISQRDKRRLVERVLGGVRWERSRHLVALLVARGHRALLPDVVEQFRGLLEREQGVLPVEVTAAVALSEEQITRLRRALARMTGKSIKMEVAVNPEVLAGLLVRMRDRTIDGTALGRLEEMRSHLAELEARRWA